MAFFGLKNPFEIEEEFSDENLRRRAIRNRVLTFLKIAVFLIVWAFFSIAMIFTAPEEPREILVPLKPNTRKGVDLDETPNGKFVSIQILGNIDFTKTMSPRHASESDPYFEVVLETIDIEGNKTLWKSRVWNIYIDQSDALSTSTVQHKFQLDTGSKGRSMSKSVRAPDDSNTKMQFGFLNYHTESIGISIFMNSNPVDPVLGVWLGVFLVLFLYILIAFDITDRAFGGILVSLTALGILCVLGMRPSFEKILSWIDIDTLMLLFGMMILVSILSDTGLFDYLSLFAYKLSKGNTWLLLFYMYMFTGTLSAFLDNVTMVLMMVPVTIRLCEAVGLHTTFVLISIVIFSNIGGALTPVGDPPNMIIATNSYVVSKGIGFGNFTLHMFPGVLFSMLLGFVVSYFMTRKYIFTGKSNQLRQSMVRVEKLLSSNKDDDKQTLNRRLAELKERLKNIENNTVLPEKEFSDNLNDMEMKYKIRDKVLLVKSCIAFTFALSMFLLHAFPSLGGITLCWAAVLAAILLLILADRRDIDSVLDRVEWDTLIFFAALFVLTESLVEIGLIDWVSDQTIAIVMSADKGSQLAVSILLLMWISAITSAFVGNIPITTMMIKLTIKLAMNDRLNLPFQPLIWSISYGCCFGGMGTLIGASANVVTAGMANSFGYNITFKTFFYLGFPLMIFTTLIATIYLLFAHCLIEWH